MYLFIDPSEQSKIKLILFFSDRQKSIEVEWRNRELLQVIVDAFESEKIELSEITGIAVLVGKGGFSSTRIASVVGNGFAYALHIPIVGVEDEHALSFERAQALC